VFGRRIPFSKAVYLGLQAAKIASVGFLESGGHELVVRPQEIDGKFSRMTCILHWYI
jgi:hypothetical protein